ncbi:hypothetical protein BDF19DRAFT_410755 [Syncephalis fuscata]|nr:hypothetical protein BDF19DRAFT_410755 [Syncephalis fuscata]
MADNQSDLQYLWGVIPIDPSGEQSAWDFFMLHTSVEEARERAQAFFLQACMTTVVFVVFIRNLWHASILVYKKPTSVGSWCCFLPALVGTISGAMDMTLIMPNGLSCRVCNMTYSFGVTLSKPCIAGGGYCFNIAGTCHTLDVLAQSRSVNTAENSCAYEFPSYLPWYRLALDVSINTVFSTIFLNVVIKQYNNMGNKCWKKLHSDGLFYLLCVVLSNISCAFIIAFKLFGGLSEIMFFFDWVITSMLLIHQHEGMREAFYSYNYSSDSNKLHYR